ncbi:hypothetical protein A7985_05300 [Pseudoalteromonas luteoviolacea]|uniref:Uncharacterized protein n=1 Tax=Pseudoalteromonas luteoviolacea TaxID=43657 RepID=A0A1C0TVM2_9GAMM|nr:hypothetical protein A7985_05300 [Pseudoalteromonas luteoviolacea]
MQNPTPYLCFLMIERKYKVIASFPIFGLILDILNGKGFSDYVINGFNLSFAVVYFLIIRFIVVKVTIVHIQKTAKFYSTVLSLIVICAALLFCAYHFYLSEPFRIVYSGKYTYHALSLGVFLSLHSILLAFIVLFGLRKIVQGKYRIYKA